jgi:ABC-type multidrug transport system fused ATPase/permease subunit
MVDRFRKTFWLSTDLYSYIWRTSRPRQVGICILTMVLAPLMMVPLELQRRIVNEALPNKDVWLLAGLGGVYLGVVCLQGAIKFWLNMLKGMAIEGIARNIRLRVVDRMGLQGATGHAGGDDLHAGTAVSMLAGETEDVSGFGGDAFGLPLLTAGTIAYVAAYLLWVEPAIAILAVVIYLPQALIVPITQYAINRLARLRIVNVRSLGRLTVRTGAQMRGAASLPTGASIIDRIYHLRIAIYLRKYLLAALGNFLDSLGIIVVLTVGGYMVIHGQTQVGTLLVFISGLGKIADPWDELINFYRSVSNTAVAYDMIRSQLQDTRR